MIKRVRCHHETHGGMVSLRAGSEVFDEPSCSADEQWEDPLGQRVQGPAVTNAFDPDCMADFPDYVERSHPLGFPEIDVAVQVAALDL